MTPPTPSEVVDAARDRNPGRLRSLLERGGDPRAVAGGATTVAVSALQAATGAGLATHVRMLLDAGADADDAAASGWPPLTIAAADGRDDLVVMLLGAGADPDGSLEATWRPLQAALAGRHHRIVARLVGAGADPDVIDDMGRTLLHIAVDAGPRTVAALVAVAPAACRFQADRPDADGETPRRLAERLGPAPADHWPDDTGPG